MQPSLVRMRPIVERMLYETLSESTNYTLEAEKTLIELHILMIILVTAMLVFAATKSREQKSKGALYLLAVGLVVVVLLAAGLQKDMMERVNERAQIIYWHLQTLPSMTPEQLDTLNVSPPLPGHNLIQTLSNFVPQGYDSLWYVVALVSVGVVYLWQYRNLKSSNDRPSGR